MKLCLMIQMKDNKKFFTHEKNFPQLIEFSKIFNAEISTVQIPNEAEVLDLEELAPALCEKKSQKTDYKIIEIKLGPRKKSRKNILSTSKGIQKHIEKSLLKGNVVSLKQLTQKYKELTSACLCIHFRKIRGHLEKQGYTFVKVGGGKYKLNA